MSTVESDAFHDHLDECAQCREQPFNLCEVGAKLLPDAAQAAAGELRDTGLMGTTCPRCFGPKKPGSHDCHDCSRLIAERVGHQGKRTDDGLNH